MQKHFPSKTKNWEGRGQRRQPWHACSKQIPWWKNAWFLCLACVVSRSRFSSLLTGAMAQSMSTSAKEVSFCFVTTPNQDIADKLSDLLVTEKLAACVNAIPGRSFSVQCRTRWCQKKKILVWLRRAFASRYTINLHVGRQGGEGELVFEYAICVTLLPAQFFVVLFFVCSSLASCVHGFFYSLMCWFWWIRDGRKWETDIYVYTHTHTHTHIYIYIYTHTNTVNSTRAQINWKVFCHNWNSVCRDYAVNYDRVRKCFSW